MALTHFANTEAKDTENDVENNFNKAHTIKKESIGNKSEQQLLKNLQ